MDLTTKKMVAAVTLSVSAGGLTSVTQWEGIRYRAYNDVAGIATVCYGHTSDVVWGYTYTEGECLIKLEGDLRWSQEAVRRNVKVPISQDQFDALVSLVYNIGETAFRNSTLLRVLNAGDYTGAADQFLRWNRSGGRYVQGLMNRRLYERDLFIRGTPYVQD